MQMQLICIYIQNILCIYAKTLHAHLMSKKISHARKTSNINNYTVMHVQNLIFDFMASQFQ